MTWSPTISSERRAAIGRAGRAVVRLAVDPEAKEPARRRIVIVNDVQTSPTARRGTPWQP